MCWSFKKSQDKKQATKDPKKAAKDPKKAAKNPKKAAKDPKKATKDPKKTTQDPNKDTKATRAAAKAAAKQPLKDAKQAAKAKSLAKAEARHDALEEGDAQDLQQRNKRLVEQRNKNARLAEEGYPEKFARLERERIDHRREKFDESIKRVKEEKVHDAAWQRYDEPLRIECERHEDLDTEEGMMAYRKRNRSNDARFQAEHQMMLCGIPIKDQQKYLWEAHPSDKIPLYLLNINYG